MTPDHLGPRPPKTGQMLFAVHAFPLEGRLANIHVRRGHHTPVVSTRLNFPLFRKQDRQVVVLDDIAILPHLWFLYTFILVSGAISLLFRHVSPCFTMFPVAGTAFRKVLITTTPPASWPPWWRGVPGVPGVPICDGLGGANTLPAHRHIDHG